MHTFTVYDPFYSGNDQKVKRINTTLSKAGSREKRGIRQERKKRGKKKKRENIKRRRGHDGAGPGEKQSNTYLIHTHIQPACHSYVREEGKPQLEINYSVPFTEGIWGFFSLFPFSGHTPLPWRHLTLWAHCYQKKPAHSFQDDCGANAHCFYLS